jgi:hypothetical protein
VNPLGVKGPAEIALIGIAPATMLLGKRVRASNPHREPAVGTASCPARKERPATA